MLGAAFLLLAVDFFGGHSIFFGHRIPYGHRIVSFSQRSLHFSFLAKMDIA